MSHDMNTGLSALDNQLKLFEQWGRIMMQVLADCVPVACVKREGTDE